MAHWWLLALHGGPLLRVLLHLLLLVLLLLSSGLLALWRRFVGLVLPVHCVFAQLLCQLAVVEGGGSSDIWISLEEFHGLPH